MPWGVEIVRDYGTSELLVKHSGLTAAEEVSGDRLEKLEDAEERVALRYEKEDLEYLG